MEKTHAVGFYSWQKHAFAGGPLLSEGRFDNVVCTLGKNAVWNAALAGSSYTVTGPFMGLISSASFSAVSASDTIASHSGWTEADSTNAPTYTVGGTSNRATVVFGAASSGSAAITAIVYTATASGTIEGAFMVFGASASATWANTSGVLLSAGTFTASQAVVNGNTLTVSYSIAM